MILNAPQEATCSRATIHGYSESTLDLFLHANSRGVSASTAQVVFPPGVGGSDHAPIATTITHPPLVDTRTKLQFLPTPHRRNNDKLRKNAVAAYAKTLPKYVDRFLACQTTQELNAVYLEFLDDVKAPWMTKAAPKPARFRKGWNNQLDNIAKARSRELRKQHRNGTTTADKQRAALTARKHTRTIRRLLKQKRHD